MKGTFQAFLSIFSALPRRVSIFIRQSVLLLDYCCWSVSLDHCLHQISQFSRSVVSDSLRPLGLQRARLPCPSPPPSPNDASLLLCNWLLLSNASQVAVVVRNPPASAGDTETCVWSLGRVGKISLEKRMATTAMFLPGESHGQRGLVGYRPQGRKESDTTE